MNTQRHTEPELVHIGFAWLAAALLCAVAFPELEELRATMGPLVINLFAIALLIGLSITTSRAIARSRREDAEKPTAEAPSARSSLNDFAVPFALLLLFLVSLF
jgi:hypothetical protein